MIRNLFSSPCKNTDNDEDTYICAKMHMYKRKELKQNKWVCCKTATERANNSNHHQ